AGSGGEAQRRTDARPSRPAWRERQHPPRGAAGGDLGLPARGEADPQTAQASRGGRTVTPDDFEGWYVVVTRFRSEEAVVERLREEAGIEAWCPMEKHLVRHARQSKTVERPLIPRHLFAQVRVKGDFYTIKTTMG